MQPPSEIIKQRMRYALEQAKKYDRKHARGLQRLKSFSLLARLINPRFDALRDRIRGYANERYLYMTVAIGFAKQLKELSRKSRQQ